MSENTDLINDAMIYAQKLWPNWDARDEEIGAWCYNLRLYEPASIVKALREHQATKAGSFKKPQMHAVIEIVKHLKRDVPLQKHDPKLVYRIECAEHSGESMVGLGYDFVDNGDINTQEQQHRAAEIDRKNLEDRWLGRWVVHYKNLPEALPI